MDDDLLQRIVIQPWQERCQLIFVVQSQPRLDGELQGQSGQDLVEKGEDGLGIGQQA